MPDKVWDALANWSIGLTVIIAWWLWLRYRTRNGEATQEQHHIENRDLMRDTHRIVQHLELLDTRVLEHANNLVVGLVRVAEILKEVTGELRQLRERN